MKQGDFTKLAKDYRNRTGYSERVLRTLASYIGAYQDDFKIADVGAGTGKLTEMLLAMGFSGYAVEPNDAMREEGIQICGQMKQIVWSKGSGEETGLKDNSVDWLFMASSFHWTDYNKSLREFHRVLRPGGFFTALWNPRDLDRSPFHKRIENMIYEMIPGLNRVSSGSKEYTKGLEEKLLTSGFFDHLLFMEAPHEEIMTKDRYMGAWRSVNDIQAQAGEAKFQDILQMIETEIKDMNEVAVPYKTRAWTVRVKK
ncbi:MAG TPA: class I SAM-dependent methyltransferase [Leptospiraceae bacterium]|nr:class I SAM-dependent methyltransferase [Leptospiraceae bacterium]